MIKKLFLLLSLLIISFSAPELTNAEKHLEKSEKALSTARTNLCKENKNCIDLPSFTIQVKDLTPGGNNLISKKGAKLTIIKVLLTFIEKLMVVFGVLALLMMTVSGAFMILYNGSDEILSKGKNMFSSSLIALVVALSSGLLVRLISYLLYI